MLEGDATLVEQLSTEDQRLLDAAEQGERLPMDPNPAPNAQLCTNPTIQVVCPTLLRPLISILCTDQREEKDGGRQDGIDALGR